MRFNLSLGSKAKRFFLSSPAQEKAVNGVSPVGGFVFKSKPALDSGFRYSDFGSREEIFFDSKAWIDSDCEDDFYSVNGDFTPSRGSTPMHHFSTPASPQARSEPSPTDGKKKLFDFLQETAQVELEDYERNTETNGKSNGYKLSNLQPQKSSEGSRTNSTWSTEATPNGYSDARKQRTGKPKQCCFPVLVSSRSFNDRRKQKMSPGS